VSWPWWPRRWSRGRRQNRELALDQHDRAIADQLSLTRFDAAFADEDAHASETEVGWVCQAGWSVVGVSVACEVLSGRHGRIGDLCA
jgi:hypothetical protein